MCCCCCCCFVLVSWSAAPLPAVTVIHWTNGFRQSCQTMEVTSIESTDEHLLVWLYSPIRDLHWRLQHWQVKTELKSVDAQWTSGTLFFSCVSLQRFLCRNFAKSKTLLDTNNYVYLIKKQAISRNNSKHLHRITTPTFVFYVV